MSEQIQKAFDEWSGNETTDQEHDFAMKNREIYQLSASMCAGFYGGYTSCQSRIREKIAELEARVKDEMMSSKYGTSAIDVLRELLGEI